MTARRAWPSSKSLLFALLLLGHPNPAPAADAPDRGKAAQQLAQDLLAELRSQLKGGRLVELSVSCFSFEMPALFGPRPSPSTQSPCGFATAKVQSVEDPFGIDSYQFNRGKLTGPEPVTLFRRMKQEDLDDCLIDLDAVDTSLISTVVQDAVGRLGGQPTMVTLSRGCEMGPPLARSPYQGPNEARWRVGLHNRREIGTLWYDLAGTLRFQSPQPQ